MSKPKRHRTYKSLKEQNNQQQRLPKANEKEIKYSFEIALKGQNYLKQRH